MNYFRCGGGRSTHTASQITVAKTPLATFEGNVSGLYIPEILAYIQASQSGTGDPSPSNPRAISGFSSITVTNNDGETPPRTEETVTVNLGGTYYGGTLNLQTGLLTMTKVYYNMADLSYTTTSWGAYRSTTLSDDIKYAAPSEAMCDIYNFVSYSTLNQQKPNNSFALSSNYIYVLADTSPVGNVCYNLLTPRTIQLTPAQIEQLLGQNNVFCSSGDVAVKYWKID